MVWLFQCLLCLLKVVYPLVVKETKMKKICAYLFLITTLFSQQEDGITEVNIKKPHIRGVFCLLG